MLLLFTACKESYPEIEYDDSYLNKELSTIEGSNSPTPIIPVFGDPEYSISTRGTGVFYDYGIDADHWTNAEFRTFAFLTDNSFSRSDSEGYANYTNTDTLHTLLFNQRMKIADASGQVMFVGEDGIKETKFYNFNRQNWKYKFFTYYADDSDDRTSLTRTSDNKVKIDVDIDGSQDIIHSFAYHNDDQFEKALSKLVSEEQRKVMQNYGQEIIYSSISGHHLIQPIFNANHLLTRFDFQIRGAKAEGMPDNYKSVVVRSVKIKAKYHATLTVANDKWDMESYNAAIDSNTVLMFAPETKLLDLQMDTLRCDDAQSGGWASLTSDPLYTYKADDAQFHVSSTAVKSLGKPMLLPPADEYEVHMNIDFLDLDDSDPTNVKLNKSPINLGDVVYNVKYQDLDSGEYSPFLAGHVYNIVISVYGPQQISATLNLKSWVTDDDGDGNDNHVDVGGDEEDEI